VRSPRRVVYACALVVAVTASAQTPVLQPNVPPPSGPNIPNSANVPAPPTGPGPSTGGPFGIRLEVQGARPSDFALAQYPPGSSVGLGASFYDTANGQTLHGSCIPEYDLSNQLAPDGTPRATFTGIGAEVTGNGTKCHGACFIKFASPGAFSVSVHCLDHPEISSVGNQGDFSFETSTAPWSGPQVLHPVTPSLLHPPTPPAAPAPAATTTAAAAGHSGGISLTTQILLGIALAGATLEVISLASSSGDGGGGGGGGTTVYCFDLSGTCSPGRFCDFSSDSCMTDESDTLKLCSSDCNCAISKPCFSCTMGVNGCMPMGARTLPPTRVIERPTSSTKHIARTSPPPPAASTSASAGFPWLRAAEIAVVVGAATFTVYELTHSKTPMRLAPWMGPEGGGLTLMGAF
jgi:hypothetical protein